MSEKDHSRVSSILETRNAVSTLTSVLTCITLVLLLNRHTSRGKEEKGWSPAVFNQYSIKASHLLILCCGLS